MPVAVPAPTFRRYLVAPGLPAPPQDATLADERLTSGLPHPVGLDGELSLLLVLPTGVATAWRDAPLTAVVTSSRGELAPAPGDSGDDELRPGAPARLVLMRGGRPAGAAPLAAGLRWVVPEGDRTPGIRVEVTVREWDLMAGSVGGPRDVGSRLALAWRRVDEGTTWYRRTR